jgi:hypothetical protein
VFERKRHATLALAAIAGTAVAVASAGTAVAISGGGYSPAKQGCTRTDTANNHEEGKQDPHCHDISLTLGDGRGHTYFQFGTNTTSEGNNVHQGDIMVSPDGSGTPKGTATGKAIIIHFDTNYQPIPAGECGLFDLLTYVPDHLTGGGCDLDPSKLRLPKKLPSIVPTIQLGSAKKGTAPDLTDLRIYFGADDGLDTGEHDEPNGKHGTKTEQNGPSDGGAIVFSFHPAAIIAWMPTIFSAIEHGSMTPFAENPLPILDTGFGACADGICFAAESKRRVGLVGGGGSGKNRDVYNYQGKTFDPYDCSGESPAAEKKCHDANHKNEDAYLHQEAHHVNVEPGVQIFEDPDPNGSPLLPTYPLPGVYVGTCGVTLGGGPIKLPKTPLTNSAGQLSLSPTKC